MQFAVMPRRFCLLPWLCLCAALLSGCAAMPTSGPSRHQVQQVETSPSLEGISLVTVDDALARKLTAAYKNDRFSDVFGTSKPLEYLILPGDVVEVAIWEAPPAVLFGSAALSVDAGTKATRAETLPAQMVMEDGKINMPFAGRISVAGRSIRMIEDDIARRLHGQANNPQVMVRIVGNNTSNATIIGDIKNSALIPLTPKGERLLDAIALAGGVTQAVNRMSVRLSREAVAATMPLDEVIHEPKQNVALMPGDVVTALYQPKNFSVFGAVGRSQEIPFEAKGISLAQALARSGGLDDSRADPRGVFLFRFENARLVDAETKPIPAADGTTPVVYQVNLRDPASFFVTQNFPIQDRDVIYVANAPAAELEKFLRMVGLVFTPAVQSVNTANVLRIMNQ